jgi:MipA family protein
MLSSLRLAVTLSGLAAGLVSAGQVTSAYATGADWSFPTEWQAGGIVIVTPKYEGSRDHRVIGLPIVAPAGMGESRVQVKGADDVRLRLVSLHGLELGAVTGWRFGRDEDDGRRLRGLGDVDGGLALGGYAAYRFGMVSAFASYSHQATGDETGGLVRFGVESRMPVAGKTTLTAMVGATWASDDYMRSYFGVSSAQSVRSGLAAYGPLRATRRRRLRQSDRRAAGPALGRRRPDLQVLGRPLSFDHFRGQIHRV